MVKHFSITASVSFCSMSCKLMKENYSEIERVVSNWQRLLCVICGRSFVREHVGDLAEQKLGSVLKRFIPLFS